MKYFKLFNQKIRISVSVFFALSMVLISCSDRTPDQVDSPPSKEMLAHIIKTDKAVSMYQNYEKERISILKDTLNALYGKEFNDTRRVWFDLKTLKNYIAYVEKKSAENKINPEGLQFYFSVYGDEDGNQKNHQTFFIAPTTKNEGVQSGYTITKTDGKSQALFLKTILKNTAYKPSENQKNDKAGFLSFTQDEDEEGLLFNRGNGGPPNGNN